MGVLENAQAMNEKLLKLLVSGGNRFPIEKIPVSHLRSQLVSPSRHVTVRNGETLGTMLGAVVASKSTVNNILPKKNPYTVITLETIF